MLCFRSFLSLIICIGLLVLLSKETKSFLNVVHDGFINSNVQEHVAVRDVATAEIILDKLRHNLTPESSPPTQKDELTTVKSTDGSKSSEIDDEKHVSQQYSERDGQQSGTPDDLTTTFEIEPNTGLTTETRSTQQNKHTMPIYNEGGKTDKFSKAEKHHIAFLKVHKTGSSSVQNIFLRFGNERNLTFVLAHDDMSKSETKYPNVISYRGTLSASNIVPPPPGKRYDIMCCHVNYNDSAFRRFLPKDTTYIAIVRDPITRLESAIRYFRMLKDTTLSRFADNPLDYGMGAGSMINNRIAFEFNVPEKFFPTKRTGIPKGIPGDLKQYMNHIRARFDLILVTEKLGESIVLMKRMLSWHVKNVVYQKQLVADKTLIVRFNIQDKLKLQPYLYLDFALYQMATQDLEFKIQDAANNFQGEVDHFKHVIQSVSVFCKTGREASLHFEATEWDSAFNVTSRDCRNYSTFEIAFIQEIRKKMYGHLGN